MKFKNLMKNCAARRRQGKGRGQEKVVTDSGRASGWASRLPERLFKVFGLMTRFFI